MKRRDNSSNPFAVALLFCLLDMAQYNKAVAQAQATIPVEQAALYVYPAPEGAPMMRNYKVRARAYGGEWHTVDTYEAKANCAAVTSQTGREPSGDAPVAAGRHRVCSYSYGYFDFTGAVDVEVVTSKQYRSARIRPGHHGIVARLVNDTILRFTLLQPENISVEFDGDITSNLLLFTNKPIVYHPVKGHKEITIEAGYHALADTLRLPSHSTLYIKDGAYVDGVVLIEDVEDVRVIGRGVVRPSSGREGIKIGRSRNVRV